MKQIIITQRENGGVTIEVGDNTTTDHIQIQLNRDENNQICTIIDNAVNQIAST